LPQRRGSVDVFPQPKQRIEHPKWNNRELWIWAVHVAIPGLLEDVARESMEFSMRSVRDENPLATYSTMVAKHVLYSHDVTEDSVVNT
jgi:hypothetical protein